MWMFMKVGPTYSENRVTLQHRNDLQLNQRTYCISGIGISLTRKGMYRILWFVTQVAHVTGTLHHHIQVFLAPLYPLHMKQSPIKWVKQAKKSSFKTIAIEARDGTQLH